MSIVEVATTVLLVASVALLPYLGYFEVEPGFIAQRKFLGRLYGESVGAGPHFMIPGSKIITESARTHEDEFPAEPEKVQKSHKDDPNKKEPFRIPLKGLETASYYVADTNTPLGYKLVTWAEYTATQGMSASQQQEYKDDPFYSMPLTITLPVVVEYDIDMHSFRDYIKNVGDMETLRKRLNDACESLVAELLGPTSAGHANDVRTLIDREFTRRLRVIVGQIEDPATGQKIDRPWGVNIRRAYLKPIDPGETVNIARSKAGAAVSAKVETITNAEAAKQKAILEGEAQAAQVEALKGKYSGEDGRFIAKLELAREVLPQTKLVLLDMGKSPFANLLNLEEITK